MSKNDKCTEFHAYDRDGVKASIYTSLHWDYPMLQIKIGEGKEGAIHTIIWLPPVIKVLKAAGYTVLNPGEPDETQALLDEYRAREGTAADRLREEFERTMVAREKDAEISAQRVAIQESIRERDNLRAELAECQSLITHDTMTLVNAEVFREERDTAIKRADMYYGRAIVAEKELGEKSKRLQAAEHAIKELNQCLIEEGRARELAEEEAQKSNESRNYASGCVKEMQEIIKTLRDEVKKTAHTKPAGNWQVTSLLIPPPCDGPATLTLQAHAEVARELWCGDLPRHVKVERGF